MNTSGTYSVIDNVDYTSKKQMFLSFKLKTNSKHTTKAAKVLFTKKYNYLARKHRQPAEKNISTNKSSIRYPNKEKPQTSFLSPPATKNRTQNFKKDPLYNNKNYIILGNEPKKITGSISFQKCILKNA